MSKLKPAIQHSNIVAHVVILAAGAVGTLTLGANEAIAQQSRSLPAVDNDADLGLKLRDFRPDRKLRTVDHLKTSAVIRSLTCILTSISSFAATSKRWTILWD